MNIYCLNNAKISRYEDKRWTPKEGKPRATPQVREEKASAHWHRPGDKSGNGNTSNSENSFEEKKNLKAHSIKDKVSATRISLPVPPKGPEPVCDVLMDLVTPIFIVFTLLFPRDHI